MNPFSPLLLCPPFGSTVVAALPLDLAAAVAQRLDAVLVVGQGVATWAGVGPAPPGVDELPYCDVRPSDDDEDLDWDAEWPDGTPFDRRGILPIHCYAASAGDSSALRRQVQATLKGSTLDSQEGVATYFRTASIGRPSLDPKPAPGGGDCWGSILMCRYIISCIDP